MTRLSRGKRLARRYPVLLAVPEDERPALVRSALRHPLVLLLVVGGGMLLLPFYMQEMFALLRVEQETVFLLKLAKLGGIVLLPVVVAVPLLSHFVLPRILVKEMRKRGYCEKPSSEEKIPPSSSSQ